MTQQNSVNLSLPYIQPAQAQKHVTHNEAIRVLDALVQPSVAGPPDGTPPANAAEGTRWIVGADAVGAWAGHEGEVAWRTDGAWSFLAPRRGWQFRVETGGSLSFDGSAWVGEGDVATFPDTVDRLGVGAAADAANRLAVSSEAVLLNHAGAGHQVKVNKAAETDTASLLFQTGFSGRAEMGTTGGDGFAVRVSADGASWRDALAVAPDTGRARFPSGAEVEQRLTVAGRWACETNNRWVGLPLDGGATFDADAGTGADPALDWRHHGPFLAEGTTLVRIEGALHADDAEVTGLELRGYVQHGDWTDGFGADGDAMREPLFATTVTGVSTGWRRLALPEMAYRTPADGFLLLFARPVGALTATRHVRATLGMTVLSA